MNISSDCLFIVLDFLRYSFELELVNKQLRATHLKWRKVKPLIISSRKQIDQFLLKNIAHINPLEVIISNQMDIAAGYCKKYSLQVRTLTIKFDYYFIKNTLMYFDLHVLQNVTFFMCIIDWAVFDLLKQCTNLDNVTFDQCKINPNNVKYVDIPAKNINIISCADIDLLDFYGKIASCSGWIL